MSVYLLLVPLTNTKIHIINTNQKKAGVATLTSGKIDFRT